MNEQSLSFDALVKAHASIAAMEKERKKPRQFGVSNKEVHDAAFNNSAIPTEEEATVRVDEIIRNEWKAKMVTGLTGVTEVSAKVLEPDPNMDGPSRPRLTKKKPTRSGVIAIKKELIRVGGKMVEVDVKVLPPGNEYFVGKTPPSGKAPHGTKTKEEDREAKAIRRLGTYLAKRSESAWEAEQNGRQRKGGTQEDYDQALQNLQTEAAANGIHLEEI